MKKSTAIPYKLIGLFLLSFIISFLPQRVQAAGKYGYLTYEINDSTREIRITGCDKEATSVNIPDTINGYKVTKINMQAFSACKALRFVSFPANVREIDYGAFTDCSSLTSVYIPDTVSSIGEFAFKGCSSLKTVRYSKSVADIPTAAFTNCYALETFTNYSNIKSIGVQSFYHCEKLSSFTIPSTCTRIRDNAFLGCKSLTSITIPNSVTELKAAAFQNCTGLKTVKLPQNLKAISSYLFYNCSSLTTVTLPDSLESIYEYAFSNCTSLKTIKIPGNLKSYGSNVFKGCSGLVATVFKDSTGEKLCVNQNVKYVTSGASIVNARVTGVVSTYYTGSAITQNPTVVVDNKTLRVNTDYTLSYLSNVNPGKAYMTIKGIGNYAGYKEVTFEIYLKPQTISCASSFTKVYGSAPFSLNANAKTAMTYKSNNTSVVTVNSSGFVTLRGVGTTSIVINAKSSSTHAAASTSVTIKVLPMASKITGVTAQKKGFKVTWKKISVQATGYQVQYSSSKSFSGAKSLYFSKYTTTSTTVSKLSAKKTYYVRVRTYKQVGGKTYYSSWSSASAVKTK